MSIPSPQPAQHLHSLPLEVQVFDTDCFGVMWHGAYTKWFEMGRVAYLKTMGLTLSAPGEPEGFIYPVIEQQFRFKRAARLGDTLRIETSLTLEGYKLIFDQKVLMADTGQLLVESQTVNTVLDMNWKLLRRIPEAITEKLQAYPD